MSAINNNNISERVLAFYEKLPFNYSSTPQLAATEVKNNNMLRYYFKDKESLFSKEIGTGNRLRHWMDVKHDKLLSSFYSSGNLFIQRGTMNILFISNNSPEEINANNTAGIG